MKKLFTLFLIALLLFNGCAKIEDMSFNKDREIVFSTGNSNSPATKAIVDTTAMMYNFGVYGYVVPGTYSANGGYLMKNAEYNKYGNAVSGTYYWPKSDNYTGIDFIFTAYSQFESAPTWENDTLKLAVPKLTQALIDNPDGFNDILWAQTSYNYHQNSLADHERVALNFKHALSWLQFRGEVINPNIKWVKVKQISFGEYRDSIPGTPGTAYQPAVPAQYDTTDVWFNLKRNTNCDGSATKTSVNDAAYVDDYVIPADLVAEIKSYYSINNGTAGDYDLHMGNTAWPSAEIRQLRIVKNVPSTYRLPVEAGDGSTIVFFDALKYLEDNGYKMAPRDNGGKPTIFDYPIIDLFVNGTAFTIVGVNYSTSNVYDANVGGNIPALQRTIELVQEAQPEVPATPGTPAVPAHGSVGLYVDGTFCLPTKSILTTTPLAVYGTQKDTTLNYVKAQIDTIFTNDHIILGNSLIVPQPVPEKITVVFDICISNPGGEDVVFTDRKITRTINTGKDADEDATYVASWGASNKYIYNFRFDGDVLDFTTSVLGWTLSGTNYHVWDYQQ